MARQLGQLTPDPSNWYTIPGNRVVHYCGNPTANRKTGFPELISCLRNGRDFVQHERMIRDGQGKLLAGIETKFEGFCSKDQIREVFSDRMAVETLIQELKNSENQANPLEYRYRILRIIQGAKILDDENQETLQFLRKKGVRFVSHPNFFKRMERTLLNHPEIRKGLGCQSPSVKPFCPIDNTGNRPGWIDPRRENQMSQGQQ